MATELNTTLPTDKRAYLLREREGPRYLLGTQLATVIASAQSSGGLFEIVTLCGGQGDNFPFHRHSQAHEGIYILDGLVEVKLGDDSYLLAPGDYAHIPAGTKHAYHMCSHHSRLLSVTSKGAVAQIYALLGTPTDLHVHPPHGAVMDLAARLAQLRDEVDFELVPEAMAGGKAQPVINVAVPDGAVPYVIASGGGVHRVVGRELYVLLATQANTNGEFIVLHNEGPAGHAIIQHVHEQHTETFFSTKGRMTMWANGEEHQLEPGDFLHVPAGTVHSFRLDSHYTSFFSVLAPGLFEPFFHILGSPYEGYIFPAEPGPNRSDRLLQKIQAGELDLKIVGPPPDGSGDTGGPSGDPSRPHSPNQPQA